MSQKIYKYSKGKVEESSTYVDYNVGDPITVAGEGYHIISTNYRDDYVVALKDTPLTVEEVQTYGIGHINRYTYSYKETVVDYNGYGGIAYYTSETCGYVNNTNLDSCSHNYNSSEIKPIVDNWSKSKFKSSKLKEVDGYKARLITLEELTVNLGCSNKKCQNSPYSWVNNHNLNYWTMTQPEEYASRYEYGVVSNNVDPAQVVYNNYFTIRPVINVYKSAIK